MSGTGTVLERVAGLDAELREGAAAFDAAGRLDPALARALAAAGVFRMLVPTELDGEQLHRGRRPGRDRVGRRSGPAPPDGAS